MPRRARELSALHIRRLITPGQYAVGGVNGLYLQVRSATARSWILNMTVGERRRMYGLGSYPTVLLDAARDKARTYRSLIEQGQDPIEERRKARSGLIAARAKAITFDEAVASVLAVKQQEFSNAKHAAQWASTLTTYASPSLGKIPISDINLDMIVKVLAPIWTTKTETATRLRQRLEAVLDWAKAMKYRTGDNPAHWRGGLDQLLPKPSAIRTRRNFAALPYADLPQFFQQLQAQPGEAAHALAFTILTAARSGEVRGARWSEFDLIGKLWTIPASRMKMKKEHRVPLSESVAALLAGVPRFVGADPELVFPSPRGGMFSDTAMLQVLHRMKVAVVPHGFRATFKTWASEQTAHPRNIIEKSLAHHLGDKVEAAYMRGDLLEKRRALMGDWASFCHSARGMAAEKELTL